MSHENEILPDGIIEQRIQRMAEDIDPHAFKEVRENPDPKSTKYQFWTVYTGRALVTAKKLVAAGWCPGPIGEKPILDKYFKT